MSAASREAFVVRVYRLFLRLYPSAFRLQFGDELVTAFAQAVSERRQAGGVLAVTRLCLSAAVDLIRHASAERLAHWRGRPSGLSPLDARSGPAGLTEAPGGGEGSASAGVSLEVLRRDVKLACRQVLRSPVHSGIAILVLAIGIGANTAVFSVVNPLLLQPLPFPDGSRLVWIENSTSDGLSGRTYRSGAYELLSERSQSFEASTAFFAFFGFRGYVLSDAAGAERLVGVDVAPGFFDVLGIVPRIGRGFTDEEWQMGGPGAVVLSDALWRRTFKADPAIVGQTVTINDQPILVAGVLPEGFDFAATFAPGTEVDFLLPARLEEMREWGNTLSVIGRLAPGVTPESARAELESLVPGISAEMNGYRFGAVITPLKAHVAGSMRQPLIVLWAAVGAMLLIVCANLSNLQLARSAARSREFAVRAALGASRPRLIVQVLAEGLVLAAAGAILGIPLAFVLTEWIAGSASLALPLLHTVRVDGAALVVTGATAILSGLAFAVLPAFRAAGGRPQAVLTDQARGAIGDAGQRRLRSALVVGEVAVAAVLLVVAGLLFKSLVSLLNVELGFDPRSAVAVRLEMSTEVAPELQRQRLLDAAAQLAAEPGIESAALTDALPLDRNRTWGVGVPGEVYEPGTQPGAFLYIVGPGYLDAMGIALREGRGFSDSDTPDAPLVAMVNETLARVLYPAGDALGRRVVTGGDEVTIVGVVADVRQTALDEAPAAQIYLAYPQRGIISTELIVRAASTGAGSAALTATRLRGAISRIDPGILTTGVRPLESLVDRTVSPRRFLLTLLGGFSFVGLLLASLGIYGVVSHSVSRRVPEIGLRLALGATRLTVLTQVMRDTMMLTMAGLGLGLVGAFAATRMIGALLYGTSPTDGVTFAGTAVVLGLTACIAAAVPARRATRVDPLTALRGD